MYIVKVINKVSLPVFIRELFTFEDHEKASANYIESISFFFV